MHQARDLVGRSIQFGIRRPCQLPREEQVVGSEQSSLDRTLTLPCTATRIRLVEYAAPAAKEIVEANPRAGETLAVGSGIDLEHLGGFLAGEVEDIAQHVGDAQLPIEAEQHRLRASEAHFARESLLFRVGPLGNLAESRPQPFV